MIYKNRFSIYFYSLLTLIVTLLFLKAEFSLSISYKEALNLFVNNSILSIITNSTTYVFGQNDLALRAPFIILYLFSTILMYKISENYFKYEKDRLISIVIFMLLPGVLSAALLVNTAIVVTFSTLFYIYYYQKYNKHMYILLPLFLLIDNSFAILFLALFFFSFHTKDRKLLYISLILFILSIYVYGFSTGGRPRSYFLDTFGIYATIFSPILFLYFIYSIYKGGLNKERSLSWYITITALLLSILISFRQKVYIEDFASFVVIAIPLMLKTFLNAYRVRLKEFRKSYNIMAILIIVMLFINVFVTFINKPFYLIMPDPKKHFVYQYHFAKDIAYELKQRGINGISVDDKELQLRLKFYELKEGEKYYLSTTQFYNYDEKIVIKYFGKELLNLYIKKLK